MSLIRKVLKRPHHPVDVIAQCVRWYLAYALSLRDLEEMMAERGLLVDHSTLYRWIIRLSPLLNMRIPAKLNNHSGQREHPPSAALGSLSSSVSALDKALEHLQSAQG